jgi:hypothetical protein
MSRLSPPNVNTPRQTPPRPVIITPLSARKHSDEQETRRKVLLLLETYTQQESHKSPQITLKIGVVGLLKEISDLALEKPSLQLLSAREQYDILQYVYHCIVTYLTQSNHSQRHSLMLSM